MADPCSGVQCNTRSCGFGGLRLRGDLEAGAGSVIAASFASIVCCVGAQTESACDSGKEERRGKTKMKRKTRKRIRHLFVFGYRNDLPRKHLL